MLGQLIRSRDSPASGNERTDIGGLDAAADGRAGPTAAPGISIYPEARPTLAMASRPRAWRAALFASVSLAAHAALYLPFRQDPAPLASLGEIAISVELVLGANEIAGPVRDRGASEASAAAALPQQRLVAETQEQDRPLPRTEAPPPQAVDAETEQAPSLTDPHQPTAAEALPAPLVAASAEMSSHEHLQFSPQREPATAAERPTQAAPALPRPKPRPNPPPQPSQAASAAATAGGGRGRGRSESDRAYAGKVAAHLARHKRFPADARSRGREGEATIAFALDGAGHVTSVTLVSGSGTPSLDAEATGMARRASPFPPPPDGRPASFTAPVSFRLR